jgi:hypothetical protein
MVLTGIGFGLRISGSDSKDIVRFSQETVRVVFRIRIVG